MTSSLPRGRRPRTASVAAIASSVRYMATPSQLTSAGRSGSSPAARRAAIRSPDSKSTGANTRPSGEASPAAVMRSRFHRCVAG